MCLVNAPSSKSFQARSEPMELDAGAPDPAVGGLQPWVQALHCGLVDGTPKPWPAARDLVVNEDVCSRMTVG